MDDLGGLGAVGRLLPPADALPDPQTPVLLSLRPTVGPVSGGTRLTVTGTHLDAGSNVSVALRGAPCPLIRYGLGGQCLCS